MSNHSPYSSSPRGINVIIALPIHPLNPLILSSQCQLLNLLHGMQLGQHIVHEIPCPSEHPPQTGRLGRSYALLSRQIIYLGEAGPPSLQASSQAGTFFSPSSVQLSNEQRIMAVDQHPPNIVSRLLGVTHVVGPAFKPLHHPRVPTRRLTERPQPGQDLIQRLDLAFYPVPAAACPASQNEDVVAFRGEPLPLGHASAFSAELLEARPEFRLGAGVPLRLDCPRVPVEEVQLQKFGL